ncbi:MAG: hypothetical protein K8W52_07655 [Deltaproteobacteria bacterium]|nr:hypothetical protein [Deltaproteobacteria bacterium]
MKKNRKPATLSLITETVRALDPAQLVDISGAMKPKKTWAMGCTNTSNSTWDCTI